MNKLLMAGSLVIALVAFSGCASIVSGASQQLSFNSEPSGADVKVNGQKTCTTPCTQMFKRSNSTIVSIEKEGYVSETINPSTGLDSWFWGNIIFGGLIGSTTDFANGAAYQYQPNMYNINLKKAENAN